MATTLGCGKCGTLFAHDGCVKDPWPPVCPSGHVGGGFAWAGITPEWEKTKREEWAAKFVSHSQPDRLEEWKQKPQQERFFLSTM